jgi:hypothetical protein
MWASLDGVCLFVGRFVVVWGLIDVASSNYGRIRDWVTGTYREMRKGVKTDAGTAGQ